MRSYQYKYDRILVEKHGNELYVFLEKDIYDQQTGLVSETSKNLIEVNKLAQRIVVLEEEIIELRDLKEKIELEVSYVSPADLQNVKNRVKRNLELKIQNFLAKKDDGNDRYTWYHGTVFLNLKFSLNSIPEDQRTPEMIQALSRLYELEIWQGSVFNYLESQLLILMEQTDIESVRQTESNFDLSVFEATDPDVYLSEFNQFI